MICSPCSARATTYKPQEICGPILVSRWTLPPFIPHLSAHATRATCVPSAPSVRLAASARWVPKACMAQTQLLETWMRANIVLCIIALCEGHSRNIDHPQGFIMEAQIQSFKRHSCSQQSGMGYCFCCCDIKKYDHQIFDFSHLAKCLEEETDNITQQNIQVFFSIFIPYYKCI